MLEHRLEEEKSERLAAEQLRHDAQVNRIVRWALVGMGLLTVALGVAVFYALRERSMADSRRIAAEAVVQLGERPGAEHHAGKRRVAAAPDARGRGRTAPGAGHVACALDGLTWRRRPQDRHERRDGDGHARATLGATLDGNDPAEAGRRATDGGRRGRCRGPVQGRRRVGRRRRGRREGPAGRSRGRAHAEPDEGGRGQRRRPLRRDRRSRQRRRVGCRSRHAAEAEARRSRPVHPRVRPVRSGAAGHRVLRRGAHGAVGLALRRRHDAGEQRSKGRGRAVCRLVQP